MKKVLIMLMMSTLILSGCTTTRNTEDNFIVGMEAAYQPFNWQAIKRGSSGVYLDGGAGIADGYDVVIASKIAKKIHRKLVIKKISWEGLPSALESGEIDAIIAGMTASPEREKGMDFTTPYYSSEMVMIVRKNSKQAHYDSVDQFKGSKVMGQKNTNYDTIIDQIKGVKHQTPKATYPELVMALRTGDADGVTAELPVATGICKANKELSIVKFKPGKGFDIDTTVSIGLKNNSRKMKLFKDVQHALDSISQEERVKIMEEAVNRAPLYQDQ